jgi:hypothetical protein
MFAGESGDGRGGGRCARGVLRASHRTKGGSFVFSVFPSALGGQAAGPPQSPSSPSRSGKQVRGAAPRVREVAAYAAVQFAFNEDDASTYLRAARLLSGLVAEPALRVADASAQFKFAESEWPLARQWLAELAMCLYEVGRRKLRACMRACMRTHETAPDAEARRRGVAVSH